MKVTKNPDPDKFPYSGYGIGFDTGGEYSLPEGSIGKKNIFFFWADISSSVYIDNKGKEPTQGLDGTTFTAKAKYPISSTISGKRFILSLILLILTIF